ncbi:hypothetical protein QBC34DRAFT_430562 [Podospora aff. communis PSN243]|uniref:Uncharacterized protein n=1 Tax=Podospora aff. communis PSN243 TaxID=3040156 RepID=A0AAV9G9D7_9PEZI|nr:hypothetical protein QBC34DRAFT_430562 [Podospora aff. communis PSN243]
MTCANILPRCYGSILAATNYVDTSTSCLCAFGMPLPKLPLQRALGCWMLRRPFEHCRVTVFLSFEYVVVQKNHKDAGQLLKAECTKTGFTLVDASSTVYFAGFNGCNGERPGCCLWLVAATSTSELDLDSAYTSGDLATRRRRSLRPKEMPVGLLFLPMAPVLRSRSSP